MTARPEPKAKVSVAQKWSAEEIATWGLEKLKEFRQRAERLGRPDLKALIDLELEARANQAVQAKATKPKLKATGVVTEFHFVCAGNRGVIQEEDGTFRTGSWVVSEALAEASLRAGALVALHESKALPSYRQGRMKAYAITPRDMINKDNLGIEFHVEPTPEPLAWFGDGAGEKGYRWA